MPAGRLALPLAPLLLAALQPPAAQSLPVTSLPGFEGPLPSKQDAGYVTVDDTNGTRYFYWFVEAETAPEAAPLVVWYSGGPGGSGMIGMWTESGPFKLDGANRPVRNALSLTRRHNVLYLEQPCGVGFSYSNSSSAYSMNDDDSARLNYVFLQRWLAAFPALQGRQLWLAGESYAGMYIPRLAEQIVAGPDAMLRGQLRGVLLGNPHIWCESLNKESAASHFQFVRSWFLHGLLPFSLVAEWNAAGCDSAEGSTSGPCEDLYHAARKAAGMGSLIDTENIREAQPAMRESAGASTHRGYCRCRRQGSLRGERLALRQHRAQRGAQPLPTRDAPRPRLRLPWIPRHRRRARRRARRQPQAAISGGSRPSLPLLALPRFPHRQLAADLRRVPRAQGPHLFRGPGH